MLKSFWQKQSYLTGFHPGTPIRTLRRLPTHLRDLNSYRKLNRQDSLRFRWSDAFPILTDMETGAGTASGQYFHQYLWVVPQSQMACLLFEFTKAQRVNG